MFYYGAVKPGALGAALSSSLMPLSSSRERLEPASVPGLPLLASGNDLIYILYRLLISVVWLFDEHSVKIYSSISVYGTK